MGEGARNLEIKIECGERGLAEIRQRLSTRNIPTTIRLDQTDTYFHATRGRLKLREITDRNDPTSPSRGELISYLRPDDAGSRWSSYFVTQIPAVEIANLRSSLDATLGTRISVLKHRDIAIWDSTRVHLDEVEDLGSFIELETVVIQSDGDAAAEHKRIVIALGLDRWPPISGSYSDLLMKKAHRQD